MLNRLRDLIHMNENLRQKLAEISPHTRLRSLSLQYETRLLAIKREKRYRGKMRIHFQPRTNERCEVCYSRLPWRNCKQGDHCSQVRVGDQ